MRLSLRDLNKIYSADYGCGIRVDSFLACLQRNGLLQRNDFLELLSVVNKDDRPSDKTSILHAPLPRFRSSQQSSKDSIAQVDTSIVTAKSVWDAVARFRSSLEKDRFEAATVTTLLVVGSEGSGKTHLCNDIGSLLEDRCIGEL